MIESNPEWECAYSAAREMTIEHNNT